MAKIPALKLKPGRDWNPRRGHPWLFSGGLAETPKGIAPGSVVDLLDSGGNWVARGYYNPKTDIAVRLLTNDPHENIDTAFFARRIKAAYDLRRRNLDMSATNAFRLVNAEGDFLPGLIADYYAGIVVIQAHTAGIEVQLPQIVEALQQTVRPSGILVRRDVAVRTREGLPQGEPEVLAGEVPPTFVVQENSLKFELDMWHGQKTGFYADQRDKRLALAQYVRGYDTLLNCFSYTAGFSVYSAHANPDLTITSVDQSAPALSIARRNFALNGLDDAPHRFLATDAFAFLQSEKDNNKLYDAVILDPPAFAKTHRERDKALQGYTRLNTLGLNCLAPGGLLVTCSCSGSITMEDFLGSLSEASTRAHRQLQILQSFENGLDHPVNLLLPESRYLKVLFCRATN